MAGVVPQQASLKKMASDNVKAFISCTILAFQFGLQPLISSTFSSKTASRTSIVFCTELEKIVIAIVSIAVGPSAVREKIKLNWSIASSLQLAALPALLYTVQNIMIQYSYTYIDSMTFNLLNQTKVIVVIMQ